MRRQTILYYLNICFLYFLLVVIFGYPKVRQIKAVNSSPKRPNTLLFKAAYPVRLTIPRLKIDLLIKEGIYNLQSWIVGSDYVYYAANTPLPNNLMGNTIVYGHNTPAVFFPTQSLQAGDKLYLFSNNNEVFVYEYREDELVFPENTKVFNTDNLIPRLTLITCSGFLNDKRRLMNFNFINIEKT